MYGLGLIGVVIINAIVNWSSPGDPEAPSAAYLWSQAAWGFGFLVVAYLIRPRGEPGKPGDRQERPEDDDNDDIAI